LDIKLHHWYMSGSYKASTHRDIHYKCFDLSNLYMGMCMIYTNCFINRFLMGKLMSSCLCTQINLMYILYNNEHSSRINCREVSKIGINLQLYSQTYLTDMSCNRNHYTHNQQYNCCNNTYWNMLNKVHNIYYKSQSHQNSI